ncbi:MAG: hypothetical protein ABDH23_03830 [Endomicrobiia bacterium]
MKKNNYILCDVVFPIPLNKKYTYYISKELIKEDIIGTRVEVDFGKEINKIGVIVGKSNNSEIDLTNIKPIKSVIDQTYFFDKEQLSTGEWLSKIYLVSFGYFLNQFFPLENKFTLKEAILVKKNGTLTLDDIESKNKYLKIFKKINAHKISLFVPSNLEEKFDFYKSLISYVIKNDTQLLLLFPNSNYIQSFSELVLKQNNLFNNEQITKKIVLYTGETPLEERYKIWFFIRNKFINVIISTKIGVFLPFNNISYIVVDEPDALGYKNPEVPMYDCLLILEKRIKSYNCRLIYSSFFPSVTHLYNYPLVSSKKNLSINKNLIKINIVTKDLTKVILKDVYKFKQALIIFPYRGSTGYYKCLICKKIFSKRKLKKEFKIKHTYICPDCGSTYYKEHFSAVKKIVSFLSSKIKIANIQELTSYNALLQNKKIEEFNNRKIDVLVSNLDILNYIYRLNFSFIGSIYFVSADEFFQKPNYLNYENFYRIIKIFESLISKDKVIEVYIETRNKENILNIDYKNFYREELKVRKMLKYPPFVYLVKLQILDKKENVVLDFKEKILEVFKKENNIEIFVEKDIEKDYNGYSSIIILKILETKMSLVEKIMLEIGKYKTTETSPLIYVQHNPLI